MERSKSGSLALAAALLFMAPYVAEFLLGNLPVTMLPALIVLAPFYGGAAILIREAVRRTGRGWPSILLLGIAYGVFEEGFTTQSLFNPDYLKIHLGLLTHAYMPTFGIGAWWTLYVVTIHAAWSICTSIALVEAMSRAKARSPWLNTAGLAITTLLFLFGAVASTVIGYRHDRYLSSPAQFITAGIATLAFIFGAFALPRRKGREPVPDQAPSPWIVAAATLVLGSIVMVTPPNWNWVAVAVIAATDAVAITLLSWWSKSTSWTLAHQLAAAAGAALAYGWHSFFLNPSLGASPTLVRIGNVIFVLIACGIIALASRNLRATTPHAV